MEADKVIMEPEKTVKKKRGRKPKNKAIINDNPVFVSQSNNLIINIPKKKDNSGIYIKEEIDGYDNSTFLDGNNLDKMDELNEMGEMDKMGEMGEMDKMDLQSNDNNKFPRSSIPM